MAELLDLGEAFLAFEPVLVAAPAPVGEVLRRDEFAVELGSHGFDNGWKAIQPGQNIGGWLTIEEALVKLFADVVGEARDFAATGGRIGVAADVDICV